MANQEHLNLLMQQGVVTWATDLGGKIKEFSETFNISIPGLADSVEPDQSPSPPQP